MLGNLINGILKPAKELVDEFHTSHEERSRAELDLYEAETDRMHVQQEERMAELDIQKTSITSKAAAGWRPAVGWVCAAWLAWEGIVSRAITGIFPSIVFPQANDALLETTLWVMLGVAGARTVEKLTNSEHRRK